MFNTGNCPSVPIVANLDGNNGNNWNDGSWLWFLIVVFAIFGGWGNMTGQRDIIPRQKKCTKELQQRTKSIK